MGKQLFVAYMPYLFMGETDQIDFGYAKVWNFSTKKDYYIKDVKIKKKLDKIFKVYKTHNYPIQGIGIISIGDTDFRIYDDAEMAKVLEIRHILFLSFLSKNNVHKRNLNTGHFMATSENFDVIYQNFILENDYVSESAGSVVNMLDGGYLLSEIKIQKPAYVLSPRFSIDAELLKILINLGEIKPYLYNRLLNATELFFESYYNSHHLSKNARILLQASSFEILLNIPETPQKRKEFKNAIKKYTVFDKEKTYVNYWRLPKSEKYKEMLTKKEIWADKFYLLRDGIVHGDFPPMASFNFENRQRHSDIATLFFILCLKRIIEEYDKNYSCDYIIKWEKWVDDTTYPKPTIKEEFIYEYHPLKLLAACFGNKT